MGNIEATPKGRVARALGPDVQYVNYDGWEDCVVVKPSNVAFTEYCLPTSKREKCPTSVWNQLKGEFDPNNYIEQVGGPPPIDFPEAPSGAPPGAQPIAGALPPKYLDIPGHDICLKSFSPLDSDHTAYCLPAKIPDYCSKNSWERLQTDFDGKCPEPSKVPGYKDCIVETNDAEHPHCLPFVYKPEYCSEKSWNEIHEKVF